MQPKFNKLALLAFACILSTTFLQAQVGSLNTSFADHGILKEQFLPGANTFSEAATGIVHLKDGRSVISILAGDKTLLSRLNADGSIDKSFAKDGFSEGVRLAGNPQLLMSDDGSFYLSGPFFTLAHILSDGTVDKKFGVNGVTPMSFNNVGNLLGGMALQKDGKIVIVAGLLTIGNNDIALVRFNKDGSFDATFGNGGKVVSDFGFLDQGTAVTIQDDGKILVGGNSAIGNTAPWISLFRYNTDGSTDLLFGKNGRAMTTTPGNQSQVALQVQQDGKILIGGSAGQYQVTRFLENGMLDYMFGFNGLAVAGFPYPASFRSLELLPDGRILAGGEINSNPAASKREIGLAQFTPNGFLDYAFGNLGTSTVYFGPYLNTMRTMRVKGDGRIMIVGALQAQNTLPGDYAILQCVPTGYLDWNFGNNGQVVRFIEAESSGFRSITLQDNKILAGGMVTNNNESDFILARYFINGAPDMDFGDQGKVVSNVSSGEVLSALKVLPGGGILAAGMARAVTNGPYDFFFAKYDKNGMIDPSFGQAGRTISPLSPNNETMNALALQPDGKFLAGGATANGPAASFILARYNPDGSLDKTFAQGGMLTSNFGYSNATLTDIQVLADGRILTLARGIYPTNTGSDIILAKYTADGKPDAGFGNSGVVITDFARNDLGVQLAVEANGKIAVAGILDAVGNYGDFAMFRYNADGSADATFGDGGKAVATSIAHEVAESFVIQKDGKYLVTGTTATAAGSDLLLIRFNGDGTIDQSFGVNGRASVNVEGDESFPKSLIAGDNLYLAGTIREIGNRASMISFIIDIPLKITCPADVVSGTDTGVCAAVVNNIDPRIEPTGYAAPIIYKVFGETVSAGTGTASGLTFNKGKNTVVYYLQNQPSTSCSFNVLVEDKEAPAIVALAPTPVELWPANHKMRDVQLSYMLTDNCGIMDSSITITSNEPVQNGESDWEVVHPGLVRLRAERLGSGSGRVYTITIAATDFSGNKTTRQVYVNVPKNQSLHSQGLGRETMEVAELNAGLQVKVLSNPTAYYFTLQVRGIETGSKVNVRIMNALGVVIEKKENVNADGNITFGAGYKPGIYFIEVNNGKERKQVSVLKQ